MQLFKEMNRSKKPKFDKGGKKEQVACHVTSDQEEAHVCQNQSREGAERGS